MNRIVFLENCAQVHWVIRNFKIDEHTKLVAITAQAMLAFEEMGLPFTPISEVVDMSLLASAERQYSLDCFNLLVEIERYILEQYPLARQVDRGFLTGQAYYVQISIGGIAARAFLMRAAIRVFSPSLVVAFQGEVDNWFANNGYVHNPWLEALYAICAETGVEIELVSLPIQGNRLLPAELKDAYLQFRSRAKQIVKNTIGYWRNLRKKGAIKEGAFRLLFVDAQLYDWSPVLDELKNNPGFSLYYLNSEPTGDQHWGMRYAPTVYKNYLWNGQRLDCMSLRYDNKERVELVSLLDDWIAAHSEQAGIKVLDMDLFPSILPHLRNILTLSLPLIRYATDVADKALEMVQPHAICFFAMPWLSAKVLADQAQQRGIPVISYQHGGSYGVQVVPTHDFAEFAYSDYFLTYGEGVLPPENPVIPTRAEFMPAGSTRMEGMRVNNSKVSNKSEPINVLWIAEVSLSNTICASWLVEDTTRYHLQKKSLEILGQAANINVVYRPFPGDLSAQATPRWLEQRSGLLSVQLDSSTSLANSILASDLVICDSSSSTTWNEVLALGKPLILYCDPQQTILMDHFAKDLEKACYWCKSVPELLAAINRLAKAPWLFIDELSQLRTEEYLRNYVLHDGHSVDNVVTFLSEVCGKEGKHG
ncbi:MAG: hypothetical protein QY332_01025 [Anaerolineales bacterium]|nr:MAG: hypothetical protein QY332_01025 [Anaerolineales bacterium]